ncbi:MAG: DUF1194 domain-containing protein [Proteobacteria bacterium]|nr:DUF1194 domain-containing protein [Pseudomonadota bacterium]
MVRIRRLLVALLLSCLWLPTTGRADDAISVDLQLILAVDSSGSINADEFRLQMEGLTTAFRNPAILEAIRRGRIGAIAVTLIEWASVDQQHQSVAWTKICDEETMAVFADQLAVTPRFIPGGSTSVSDALNYSSRLFAKSGYVSDRRVIDVSGDGSNNSGIPPDTVRDRLVEAGIVINGLAILNDEPNLKDYYAASVIGGPGSFVLVAESYETFSNAILSKLIQEIAALPTSTSLALEMLRQRQP